MHRTLIKELENFIDKDVNIQGWIYRIRKLKAITFLILRDRTGLVQCVLDNSQYSVKLTLESVISIDGIVKESKNKLNDYEIQINALELLNPVKQDLPIEINKENLDVSLDTMLNNRVLSLRHEKISSIFKVQNIIVNSTRKYLLDNNFTEIFTPKIVSEGAEGGSEVFKLNYFEKQAYLAQSPQFYKQMMVGAGFERVFEIGHAYRAEEHNTSRHLNEYISIDLEVGFIKDEYDLMKIEEGLLRYILEKLKHEGEEDLKLLDIKLPKLPNEMLKMDFNEILKILKDKFNRDDLDNDLDPEAEKQIYQYCKNEFASEFIFITNYPRKKRPLYAMPLGENGTKSFDLLFRGIEITTGGQRIHDYNMLLANMEYKGVNYKDYQSYVDIFKYGMPPHGGLAIGLERLTTRLLGLDNIREASLIPRDRTRLTP
ncbi:MAG: aspartate--tRNA(Asn) ligase [Lactobacillales bacterium]|jgi:nondiscriminating aspartyl-tRNA synthetase|nr:aspartate--tRNA(Asn) ligase [Lactobacillales bacterium]